MAQAPHLGSLAVHFTKNILKTISCVILWYVLQSIGTYTKALNNNFISNITMGDIVARNTGLTDVPLDAFSYLPDHEEGTAAAAATELATSSV